MKKALNYTIIALMGIVFVWGIVAGVMGACNANPYAGQKATVSYQGSGAHFNYNKDGKIMVDTDVIEEEQYLKVKSTDIEIVDYMEYKERELKHQKIVMDKAKEGYDAVKADSAKTDIEIFVAQLAYEKSKADYESDKSALSKLKSSSFYSFSSTFFGGYLPALVLLGILLLVNQKIEYKKEAKSAK